MALRTPRQALLGKLALPSLPEPRGAMAVVGELRGNFLASSAATAAAPSVVARTKRYGATGTEGGLSAKRAKAACKAKQRAAVPKTRMIEDIPQGGPFTEAFEHTNNILDFFEGLCLAEGRCGAAAGLSGLVHRQICLSTCFSGVGTPEVALEELATKLKERTTTTTATTATEDILNIVPGIARDCNPTCCRALLQEPTVRCLFGDIAEILPEKVLGAAQREQEELVSVSKEDVLAACSRVLKLKANSTHEKVEPQSLFSKGHHRLHVPLAGAGVDWKLVGVSGKTTGNTSFEEGVCALRRLVEAEEETTAAVDATVGLQFLRRLDFLEICSVLFELTPGTIARLSQPQHTLKKKPIQDFTATSYKGQDGKVR